MHSFTITLLILTVVLVLLPAETYAFGAGDIPDFAYLNGKAFRHGDIENILAELAKNLGHVSSGGGGGGFLGMAASVLSAAASGGEGAKFTGEDVKRVYFGNWLRDYSQAMDIAGLSKLSADTLVLIVSVLGFLTFGFATEEFKVTAERLGVYLPVEHIDNPKGYGAKEGDPRRFHPKLRPPVEDEELQIDERNGMKNYMATENRGWDTSTALIRRVFRGCIENGRRARGRESDELWEAYRLMGTGLHTLEDLLAHSNWCELALRKMGYNDVFCHVGDNVLINTPNGETHPLVTGTFGSADFLHSLMGEATDHLSQASVVDLSKKMDDAANDENPLGNLQGILKKLPIGGGGDDQMGEADDMQSKAKAYHFDPDNVAPPEVQEQLYKLLVWRDNVYRDIIKKIAMVPGLSELMENLTNALNAFVYTVAAPYVSPLLKQVTTVLSEGSKAVIDTEDQYEVFDDPNASDPSHSLLSKDHFALILNEPAGKIAQVVVEHTVKLLVQAWFNDDNADRVINEILEAFHHPWYATGRSRIHQEMFQCMENWVNGLEDRDTIIEKLTKESVREGKNKREGSDDDMTSSNQTYGGAHGSQTQSYGRPNQSSYGGNIQSSYGGDSHEQAQSRRSEYGQSEESGYSRRTEEPSYGRPSGGYGGGGEEYGRRQEFGRQEERSSYGQSESYGGGHRGERQHDDEDSYSRPSHRKEERPHHGGYGGGERREEYGEERREEYGGPHAGYGGGSREKYGGGPPRDEYAGGEYGGGPSHGEYGGRQEGYSEEPPRRFGGGDEYGRGASGDEYGRREERPEYGGQEGYAPSYEQPGEYRGGESGQQQTYGMEGLSMRDRGDNDDGERRHHGHHGQRRHHEEYE
ncbi:Het-C-domain-containing protein [Epithele typhae]|uniref:Het-C-domain-containing protein n=1 Tax=Epithele typhae TaxID=378194 RepID=UPI002008D1AD|nr:Het-C-domain-containing protein [Epithele typhae]KAH9943991.1 Het-C-domain-containing protein [Epithele typhae]